ncbi:c-type cytochrome [Pelagovum pacificum]|uniref:c-type cytochrome n=1 Tax=Pelagovum pacificum TaxID=2588711 RepID=UPI001E319E35|nr:cytochrome c family protein [Pelagovum pacificum]
MSQHLAFRGKATRRLTAIALAGLIPGLLAAQDQALIDEGETMFRRCMSCHMIGDGATNRVGPELNNVMGEQAGQGHEDYDFSDAMIEAGENGLVWTEETLDAYLENPRDYVPGTKMTFAGLRREEDRTAVIAYIASFSPDYDPAATGDGDGSE